MNVYLNPACHTFAQQLPDQQGLERQAMTYMMGSLLWRRCGNVTGRELLESLLISPSTHPKLAERVRYTLQGP